MMLKADKRAQKRAKSRYGYYGIGASHSRETSEAEVLRHLEKIKKGKRKHA